MSKTEFHEPTGSVIQNIDLSEMKEKAIDHFAEYWKRGSGDGFIDYFVDGINRYTMMIGPNAKYGIYLHYIDNDKDDHWLSLKDRDSLNVVAETADGIYASVGLFLPIMEAWDGIREFLLTGKRSELITWVKPEIIPEEGNW